MDASQPEHESLSTNSSATDSIKNDSAYSSSQKTENEPRVGKYSIVKTLEKGKYGTVKLAIHEPTGGQVAIKEIDKTKTRKLENLFREAQNMKTLDHPNIIKLLEVIETKRALYIIMEYAEGGDIFTYLRLGRMQENEAREKFRQIVSAVHYCHQKQIVHRDLKSENILSVCCLFLRSCCSYTVFR